MKNDEKLSAAELILPAIFGVGVAVATAAILIFLVGAAVYSTSDPNKLVFAASMAILAVTATISGFAGAKKGGGLLPGAIAGAVFMLVVFLLSFIPGGAENNVIASPYTHIVRLGALLLSLFGAFLASRTSRSGGKRKFASQPRRPKVRKV